MTRFYLEREAGARENVGALAVTLGVAAVTFYLVRAFLVREPVESGGTVPNDASRVLPSPHGSDEPA